VGALVHPQVQPAALTRRRAGRACAALAAAAALPRVLGCATDLWLDEAWSWLAVAELPGPLAVFTGIHHSNNHYLVSLWMYALRDAPDWAFRVPSLLAGVATVPLAAWLAGRRDPLAALVAALLVGACHLLVYFSSEARGYALVTAFSLAGWAALERELATRRAAPALAFAACIVLGFLSQLIALFFWAGAAAWSTPRILREEADPRRALRRLALLHGPPLLAFAALYLADLRGLVVGLGPPFDPERLLAALAAFVFGLPQGLGAAASLAFGAALAAALAAALRRLRRLGDDRWILHLGVIVVAPAAVLGALRPEVIEARYFVIGAAFALILWSEPLAAALRAGGVRRAAAAAALLGFLVGNAAHTFRFLAAGRGHYREALRFMASETAGRRIEVGGNHDFRVPTMLRYYARELPPEKELVYLGRRRRPPGGPSWLVLQDGEPTGTAPPTFRDPRGNAYALAAEYGYAGLAGYHWAVYRNLGRGAGAPGR
jgi:hypothetical protein